MYPKKEIFLLITLSLLLISVTQVSATNDISESLDEIDNQTDYHINDSIDKKQIKDVAVKDLSKTTSTESFEENVTNYAQLMNSINKAKASDYSQYIINLEEGQYNISRQILWRKGQGITNNLTINGNNQTLNGNNRYSFIKISANFNLQINDLIIENTTGERGSTIHNAGNVTINNVVFKNNQAITNHVYGGGAIFNTGNLSINNSTFLNNTSDNGGGAIYNTDNGYIQINTSSFILNHATLSGGALENFINGTCIIENSTFINNSANSSGIINNLNKSKILIINNSNIIDNTATYELINNTSLFEIINTTFSDNKCQQIINNNNYVEIIDSKINNNNASENLLYNNNSSITITNSTFKDNLADISILNSDGNLSINESIFDNNTNNNYLISDLTGKTEIISSKFYNNTATDLFDGSLETFTIVSDNLYLGNNLRNVTLTVNNKELYNFDEEVIISGNLSISPIYNTTITSGYVNVLNEMQSIIIQNIENGSFLINTTEINPTEELIIYYNGTNDFEDKYVITKIEYLYPEYSIDVLNQTTQLEYLEKINYTIDVKNIGLGKGFNISLTNVLPNNMKIIQVNDENYNVSTNTWKIDSIEAGETKRLNIETIVEADNDFTIDITFTDSKLNLTQNVIKQIELLKAKYQIDVSYDESDMIYSNNISYHITLSNIGSAVGEELIISSIYNNKQNSTYYIEQINPNESIILNITEHIRDVGEIKQYFYLSDKKNITDVANITFTVKNISISLNDYDCYNGEIINISATINDIYKIDGKIIFKINNITIKEHEIIINENNITLLNYKIDENWKNPQYILSMKYHDRGLDFVYETSAVINIYKLKVYSEVTPIMSIIGNVVNLSCNFIDENQNPVDRGIMKFKINSKTINKTVEVIDGRAILEYEIPTSFNNKYYTISVVYGENSKYLLNRNESILELEALETDIEITNTTYSQNEEYNITAKIKTKVNNLTVMRGNIVFKINGKTYTDKIKVNNESITFTCIFDNLKVVKNITVVYSGSNIFLESRKTLDFTTTNNSTLATSPEENQKPISI